MRSIIIEKDWVSNDLRCVVIAAPMGHRCGYVGVDEKHILFKCEYDSVVPKELIGKWESVKKGDTGKRGIVDILCCDMENPRVGILFDVHGGITYSGGGDKSSYPVDSDLWWFGYDCAHLGDGKDFSIMDERYKEFEEQYPIPSNRGPIRTLDYCITECESLAKQLSEVNE